MAKDTKPKDNQWVKDAMAGKYEYHTGGGGKKGTKPGFSKRGSVSAKMNKNMKGKVPTHGAEETGETKKESKANEMAE